MARVEPHPPATGPATTERMTVYDGRRAAIDVSVASRLGGMVFSLDGAVEAHVNAPVSFTFRLEISTRGRPLGLVTGRALTGLSARRLTVFDHRQRSVGWIRGYRKYSDGRRSVYSFVVALDEILDGALRRAVLAVPPIITVVRRENQRR